MSETQTQYEPVERHVLTCVGSKCRQCGQTVRHVPEDCPYLVLHLLVPHTAEVQEMARQSGKTTMAVQEAATMAAGGYNVAFVTFSVEGARRIQQMYRGQLNGIRVVSMQQVRNGNLRGLPLDALIADELRPEEVAELKRLMPWLEIVSARWTSR